MEEKWHTLGRCFLESESHLGIIFRQDSHKKETKYQKLQQSIPNHFQGNTPLFIWSTAYLHSYFFVIKKATTPKKTVRLSICKIFETQRKKRPDLWPLTFDFDSWPPISCFFSAVPVCMSLVGSQHPKTRSFTYFFSAPATKQSFSLKGKNNTSGCWTFPLWLVGQLANGSGGLGVASRAISAKIQWKFRFVWGKLGRSFKFEMTERV